MAQKKLSIRIDGELVTALEGTDDPAGGAGVGQVHPDAVPPGRADGRRRVPAVHRGGDRDRPSAAGLHHAGPGRDVGDHQLAEADAYRRMCDRAAAGGAQPRLRGVRVERSLRTAVDGDGRWVSAPCGLRTTIPKLPVDMSHPRYVLDHNRCILCTRCVRVCAELEGAHVWDVIARGIQCA